MNGDEPDGSPACADVEAIVVEGGEGPNEIDLSGVNGTDFPGLFAPAFEERITIDGRGGGYTVIGSELAENIFGGLGDVLDGRGEGDFYSAHADGGPGTGVTITDTGMGAAEIDTLDVVDAPAGADHEIVATDSDVTDSSGGTPLLAATHSGIERLGLIGEGGR